MNYMRIAHDPVMRMLLNNFMNQEHETERKCRWMPAANISETEQAYQLEMAVPGFNKEDFRIDLEKDILTISTERQEEENKSENTETNYRMHEFGRCNFSRSFRLSEAIDKDGIKAEYVNGILAITLPKKEEVKVKKEIQVL
jgi:HSP20 family protein